MYSIFMSRLSPPEGITEVGRKGRDADEGERGRGEREGRGEDECW